MAIWSHMQNDNQDFFLGAATRAKRLLRIAESLQGSGTLLNIGAGNGYLEDRAKQSGWCVISVDPDERTCARLVSRGIDARVGVVERLPLAAKSADVIIATELFEHLSVDSLHSALPEIRRVLAERGFLIGTVPHRDNLAANLVVCPDCQATFHRYGHQQSFTPESIRLELSRYFDVARCRPVLLPPWNILNWKGKALACMQLLLSCLGSHGSGENILFICRNHPGVN
jgi:SAM-dependent methyltransferase